MWSCPVCERKFKSNNQHHICTTKDIGELFLDKSDELVLAFDRIMTVVMDWQPSFMGPSVNTIVFTNNKAWLIIKPMKKELDIKFYHHERLESSWIKKCSKNTWRYAYHLRVSNEEEMDKEFFELLRMGYDHAMLSKHDLIKE